MPSEPPENTGEKNVGGGEIIADQRNLLPGILHGADYRGSSPVSPLGMFLKPSEI